MKASLYIKNHKDYFPVGKGWRPLVEKLIKDICLLDDTIEIFQIKEKFGGLRFYIGAIEGSIFDKIYELINEAEKDSYNICEECGTRDNVSTKGSWILTLCDTCRGKEREARDEV